MLQIGGGPGSGSAADALCHPTHCHLPSLPCFSILLPPSYFALKYLLLYVTRLQNAVAKLWQRQSQNK